MKRPLGSDLTSLGLGILFSTAFPAAFAVMFSARSSFLPALLFGSTRCLLVFLSLRSRAPQVMRAVSRAVTLVFGALTLTAILITPLSSYTIWLENVRAEIPGGSVSNILLLLTTLFSGMFGSMFLSVDRIWPFLGMGMVSFFLLSFIYRTDGLVVLFAVAVIGLLVYLALMHGRRGQRLRLLFLLLQLCAASLLLAVGFMKLTGGGKPRGSAVVSDGIYPFLRRTILDVFPTYPLLYSIPGFGDSFDETESLGGRVVLSPAPLFEIRGGTGNRLYLKTRTYDTYNGKAWRMSAPPRDEIGDFFYSSSTPVEGEISLTLLAEYSSSLPVTGDTTRIRFEGDVPPAESGDPESGFVLTDPMMAGTRFHLQTGDRGDPLEDPTLYLQLPSDLPDEVIFLAERLGRGAGDPRTVLRRIEGYLAENATYDLDAQMRGGYEDFVHSFLFEKLVGYCVHFATSFTILARMNGIPARYATGFLVSRDDAGEPATISGYAAHAWPEVWLEGHGWRIWEATPALNAGYYSRIDGDWIYSLDMEFRGLTIRQLRHILGPVRVPEKPRSSAPLMIIPPTLLLLLLGGFVLRLLVRRKDKSAGERRQDLRNPALTRLLSRMARRAARRGLPAPDRVGWIRWGVELADRAPSLSAPIRDAVAVILESVYGCEPADPAKLLILRRFYAGLKKVTGIADPR